MEPETSTIRAKSVGAARRGGVSLLPLGQWHQHTFDDRLNASKSILAMIEDSKVTVEIGQPYGDGTFKWVAAPEAGEVKDYIAAYQAHEEWDSAHASNTDDEKLAEIAVAVDANFTVDALKAVQPLPTSGPTLERAEDTHTEAAAEGTDGQASAEAAAPTAEAQNALTAPTPIADPDAPAPATKSPGKAKAKS